MSQRELSAKSSLGESLLNAVEVASFLGVSKATVYRLATMGGGLPCVQVGPGSVRFEPSAVRAYVERKRFVPQPNKRVARLLGEQP